MGTRVSELPVVTSVTGTDTMPIVQSGNTVQVSMQTVIDTLDQITSGTFTPTIQGTTTAGAGTYTLNIGHYIRIGSLVHFQLWINMSAHTGTGNMIVSGLPVTSRNISGLYSTCTCSILGPITLTAGNILTPRIANNSTSITLEQTPTGGGVSAAVPIDTAFALSVTGQYLV